MNPPEPSKNCLVNNGFTGWNSSEKYFRLCENICEIFAIYIHTVSDSAQGESGRIFYCIVSGAADPHYYTVGIIKKQQQKHLELIIYFICQIYLKLLLYTYTFTIYNKWTNYITVDCGSGQIIYSKGGSGQIT